MIIWVITVPEAECAVLKGVQTTIIDCCTEREREVSLSDAYKKNKYHFNDEYQETPQE